jgi:hypothetical protein
VIAPLLYAVLLVAVQAPAQRQAQPPSAPSKRDTIYVAVPPAVTVQTPAPSVTVEAPSETPTIILGIIGAVLLFAQWWIMRRQTEAMNKQTTLLAKQTALGEQQAALRRDEAIGTFVRLAFDLAVEFGKANVSSLDLIPANYDTHPRQVLRQASAVFAPLGNEFVMAANHAAMRLDEYFLAVERYNKPFRKEDRRRGDPSAEDQANYKTVQSLRRQVGGDLDRANQAIPLAYRRHYDNEIDYDFRKMFSLPTAFVESEESA